jgi:hypothetical protein
MRAFDLHRWTRLHTFGGVLAVLLALRGVLPLVVRHHVNRVLDSAEAYTGTIGDVDINLWRGAYEVEDLVIQKRVGGEPQPLLEAARLDLSVHWRDLLRGVVAGEAVLHRPVLELVLAPSAAEAEAEGEVAEEGAGQTGTGVSWTERLDALVPLRIDRFATRDGELRLRDETTDPPFDLLIEDFYLEGLDLATASARTSDGLATIEAAGRPFGTGELELLLELDPTAAEPRFELELEMRKVPLVELNDLLQAYGNVDAEEGELSLYAEFVVEQGAITGYVKPLLENVQVFRFREIEDPGDALEALWEGFVALASEVLENQPHDRLATVVELQGRVDSPSTDVWNVIGNVLRNGFVAALRPALDDTIELRGLEVVGNGGRK